MPKTLYREMKVGDGGELIADHRDSLQPGGLGLVVGESRSGAKNVGYGLFTTTDEAVDGTVELRYNNASRIVPKEGVTTEQFKKSLIDNAGLWSPA